MCIMLTSHQIPEPALATPREHQSEPGPVPAIRRSRRVRRACVLTTCLWTDYTYCHHGFFFLKCCDFNSMFNYFLLQ